jgi:predicted ATPase/DNA-binding CsgD family transcriptional regulator
MSSPPSSDAAEQQPNAPVPLRRQARHSRIELPLPLTSFVGREREIAAAARALRQDGVRLLTLTGPGGVGKTRLALRVAEELACDFQDGLWFVPLAPVHDPALVATVVANRVGVREVLGHSIVEGLHDFFRDKHALLILDNFEHVIDAAALVTDLLATCPQLTVIITSRAALRLSGEHDLAVPPLAVPDLARLPSLEELSNEPAVRLFIDRARAARDDFALTVENAAAVAQICHRLDGLPLAIELAAARSKFLPPQALVDRLDPGLPLLTGGPRDAPARLQTMRDAIAWSHDLLTDDERTLFRRLAVFVGGFDLAAAEAVDRQTRAVAGPRSSVLDLVGSLVEKSLLRPAGDATAADPRFGMLETIREFGLAQLADSGEEGEAQQAHAAHFLAFAEHAREHAWGPDQVHWLDRMEAEHGNLLSALVWLERTESSEALLRLVAALGVFWGRRGHLSETFRWTERALAVSEGSTSWARARVVHNKGTDLAIQGELEGAAHWLTEAASLFEALGDRTWRVYSLSNLGGVKLAQGKVGEARALFEQELATARETGNQRLFAAAHSDLGRAAARQGDIAEAEARFAESLRVNREIGHIWDETVDLMYLGGLAAARGDRVHAAQLCQAAAARALELGDLMLVVGCLERLALVCLEQPARAARLLGAAEALGERAGGRHDPTGEPVDEAAIASLRTALGEGAFAAAWAAGRALSAAAAVAEAAAIKPANQPTPRTTSVASRGAGLTPRELDVLRLLSEGYSNREIAGALSVSPRTVGNHVTSILAKLEAPSRTAAVVIAHRLGLA